MKERKRIVWIAGFLCALTLLAGCSSGQKLSDEFDTEEVKKKAEEVIGLLNEGNFTSLEEEYFSAQMKAALPAEKWESDIKPILEEFGEFQAFDKETVTGSTDKDTDQEFAVAVIKAKYEDRNAQFTISFDKKLRVSGLYIK